MKRCLLLCGLIISFFVSAETQVKAASGNSEAAATTATTTTTTNTITGVLPESDLKSEIRNLHENLRRIESALHDLSREAGRRQVIANSLYDNDAFIADPWMSCAACSVPTMMADSTKLGAFLKPRASFLKLSLTSLDSLAASVHTIVVTLTKDPAITSNTKAKVDLDVVGDALKNFDAQLVSLKALCNVDAPDNAQILMAVGTLKQTVDGIDTVGGRLWKAEKNK